MVVQQHRDDEKLITALVERWVAAIRTGDLEGVAADHADDIMMFDVPPPQDGIRGIDAYRNSWPPFFRWPASGAVFEIVRVEVAAGTDMTFAHLLLRCGTPDDLARRPEQRLRITLGLRKQAGRWIVAHDHHSFPLAPASDCEATEHQIRSLHERWFDATAAKDLDGLISYEHVAPLQHVGRAQMREVCRQGLDHGAGAVFWQVPDMTVLADEDLAVTWALNQVRVEQPDGSSVESWSRGTRVFRRTGSGWSMVHQHLSYPVDPQTGAVRSDLTL